MKQNIILLSVIFLFLFIISCNDHISPTLPMEETPTPTQELITVPVAETPTPTQELTTVPVAETPTPTQELTTVPVAETPTLQPTLCIPGDINYETIKSPPTLLNYSYLNGPVTCVARTYEECALLFGENFAKTIDFNKKIVIGSFNYGSTGGYSTTITKVTTDCSKITIHISNRIPCPYDYVIQALTYSRHVITINKTTMPIDFDIKYNECCPPTVNYEDISSDLIYNCSINRDVYIINSETEFNAVFNNSDCLVKKPNIDFSNKTLISIFMGGPYPDSCFSNEIATISKNCFFIQLTIKENYGYCPKTTCLTVLTYPQKHILIDKTSLQQSVKFYLIKDSDFDGHDDRKEFLAGTDICDPASHP